METRLLITSIAAISDCFFCDERSPPVRVERLAAIKSGAEQLFVQKETEGKKKKKGNCLSMGIFTAWPPSAAAAPPRWRSRSPKSTSATCVSSGIDEERNPPKEIPCTQCRTAYAHPRCLLRLVASSPARDLAAARQQAAAALIHLRPLPGRNSPPEGGRQRGQRPPRDVQNGAGGHPNGDQVCLGLNSAVPKFFERHLCFGTRSGSRAPGGT